MSIDIEPDDEIDLEPDTLAFDRRSVDINGPHDRDGLQYFEGRGEPVLRQGNPRL
jgi:hypothetical protein